MPSLKENLNGTPHVHSYIKRNKKTYKCSDPNCTHFTLKVDIVGKTSLCPQCMSRTLILDYEALRRAKPLCTDCRNTKEAKKVREIKDILEKELGL